MPGAVPAVAAMGGFACLLQAGRLLGRRPDGARVAPGRARARRAWLRLLDAGAGWLDRRAPRLRRAGDDPALIRRLALAPDAWPWRLAGVGTPTPDDRMAGRLATLRAGALAAAVLLSLGGLALAGAVVLPFAAVLVVAAAAGLDLATAIAAREAERRLADALPDLLDGLASALEAGLVLEQALHLAGAGLDPPLPRILDRVLIRVRTGEPPAAALSREAERCGVDGLVAAAGLVRRGRDLGEPVAPGLLGAAAAARSEASSRAMARSARASALAALVVAVVIAPACVAAVLAALLAGLLGAGNSPPGG